MKPPNMGCHTNYCLHPPNALHLPLNPKLPIDICLCERSEAISVYYDEIATHPIGARDDSDSVFLMAILGLKR